MTRAIVYVFLFVVLSLSIEVVPVLVGCCRQQRQQRASSTLQVDEIPSSSLLLPHTPSTPTASTLPSFFSSLTTGLDHEANLTDVEDVLSFSLEDNHFSQSSPTPTSSSSSPHSSSTSFSSSELLIHGSAQPSLPPLVSNQDGSGKRHMEEHHPPSGQVNFTPPPAAAAGKVVRSASECYTVVSNTADSDGLIGWQFHLILMRSLLCSKTDSPLDNHTASSLSSTTSPEIKLLSPLSTFLSLKREPSSSSCSLPANDGTAAIVRRVNIFSASTEISLDLRYRKFGGGRNQLEENVGPIANDGGGDNNNRLLFRTLSRSGVEWGHQLAVCIYQDDDEKTGQFIDIVDIPDVCVRDSTTGHCTKPVVRIFNGGAFALGDGAGTISRNLNARTTSDCSTRGMGADIVACTVVNPFSLETLRRNLSQGSRFFEDQANQLNASVAYATKPDLEPGMGHLEVVIPVLSTSLPRSSILSFKHAAPTLEAGGERACSGHFNEDALMWKSLVHASENGHVNDVGSGMVQLPADAVTFDEAHSEHSKRLAYLLDLQQSLSRRYLHAVHSQTDVDSVSETAAAAAATADVLKEAAYSGRDRLIRVDTKGNDSPQTYLWYFNHSTSMPDTTTAGQYFRVAFNAYLSQPLVNLYRAVYAYLFPHIRDRSANNSQSAADAGQSLVSLTSSLFLPLLHSGLPYPRSLMASADSKPVGDEVYNICLYLNVYDEEPTSLGRLYVLPSVFATVYTRMVFAIMFPLVLLSLFIITMYLHYVLYSRKKKGVNGSEATYKDPSDGAASFASSDTLAKVEAAFPPIAAQDHSIVVKNAPIPQTGRSRAISYLTLFLNQSSLRGVPPSQALSTCSRRNSSSEVPPPPLDERKFVRTCHTPSKQKTEDSNNERRSSLVSSGYNRQREGSWTGKNKLRGGRDTVGWWCGTTGEEIGLVDSTSGLCNGQQLVREEWADEGCLEDSVGMYNKPRAPPPVSSCIVGKYSVKQRVLSSERN